VNVRQDRFAVYHTACGILFGRLLKHMKDKGTSIGSAAQSLPPGEPHQSIVPDDWPLLQPMLESVKTLIYEMQLDKAKKEMTDIETVKLI
jgi:hypothetical protein